MVDINRDFLKSKSKKFDFFDLNRILLKHLVKEYGLWSYEWQDINLAERLDKN